MTRVTLRDSDRPRSSAATAVPIGSARPRAVHRLAFATAAATFAGIVTGGVVTSTESGRVDTNWPSFDGNVLPSFSAMAQNDGLLVEHGHRLLMASVGLLALAIPIVARCCGESRRRVRVLAICLPFLVLPPAILGGLTVLGGLHPALSILHVAVAMVFVSAVTAVSVLTSRVWFEAAERYGADSLEASARERLAKNISGLPAIAATATAFIWVQIVLGAVPRHATADVGGSTMLMVGNVVHIVWAFAVVTIALFLAGRVLGRLSKVADLLRPAAGLFVLLLVQVFLGFATFISQPKAPAPVVDEHPGFVASGSHEALASVHQAAGVLILLVSLVLTLRAFRIRDLCGRFDPAPATGGDPA